MVWLTWINMSKFIFPVSLCQPHTNSIIFTLMPGPFKNWICQAEVIQKRQVYSITVAHCPWSHPGSRSKICILTGQSEPDLKIKSSVFPDLGNVGAFSHWVRPCEIKASINITSIRDACTTLSLVVQSMLGKSKSLSKNTSLPLQESQIKLGRHH